jgi:integrase
MDNAIKEAVEWATNRLETGPSPKSQKQYKAVASRIIDKPNSNWSKIKNTRNVQRAACRFHFATEILKCAKDNPTEVSKLYGFVKFMKLVADKAQKKYSDGKDPKTGKAFLNGQRKKSKRRSLCRLVRDWREQLVLLSSNSKYADAIKVLAFSGARPSEIEKGIEIKCNELEKSIEVKIYGAKCSDITEAGQEWRILVLDARHPLLDGIKDGTYKAKAHAVEDAISHYGKKISSNKKNPISAYSLRHAAASDFKASGLSKKQIAASLGHQSTATMSTYGTKSRGQGIIFLKSVSAATRVRTPGEETKSRPTPKP